MISDADRTRLADLAMRALDTIVEDYGEDAVLRVASLIFEVETKDDDGEPEFHVNYKSTESSPHHIGGLYQSAAMYFLSP